MTPEQNLMQRVRAVCGDFLHEAADGTMYQGDGENFLAALTANESGGDPTKTRFESAVFVDLCNVYLGLAARGTVPHAGEKPHYGEIGGTDLQTFFPSTITPTMVLVQLKAWATSWGPTQIMGYEALAHRYNLEELPNLQKHYPRAIQLLEEFRRRWNLASVDWESLFRCWNTGRPDGTTADPQYVANGLARMNLYAQGPNA